MSSEILYHFSHSNENIFEINPYVLGILKYDGNFLVTPLNLRYFKEPPLDKYPLNLEADEYVARTSFGPYDKVFESFLSSQKVKDELKGRLSKNTKIFATRGVFTNFLVGAHNLHRWCIYATKIGENIFLNIEDDRIAGCSKNHWKFAQHCFANSPTSEADTSEIIHEDNQYYGLFHSSFGDFDLIYKAEITGVISNSVIEDLCNFKNLNDLHFVLTKTTFPLYSQSKWDYKYLNWWAQASTVKVNDIYYGIKSKLNGEVVVREKVRHFDVNQTAENAHWKKEHLVGEFYNVLEKLKIKMNQIDCPNTTCELNFNPQTKDVTFKIHAGWTCHSFVSDELIEYVRTNI